MNNLQPQTPLEQLHLKVGLLLLVMPQHELARALHMNRHTLRSVVNRGTIPRAFNETDIIRVWQQYYRRRCRYQTDTDPIISEIERKALALIGSHIDPQFLKFNPLTNKLHGRRGRVTVTDLVRSYINDHYARGATLTHWEIVVHFRSKEFADKHGVRINEQTCRSAIRRAIGRSPELADTVTKASPGRKRGSRVIAGTTHRPNSRVLKAAQHLLED